MALKHRTPIQIRFKDVDALGHVNNANHVTYFEYARIRFFDELIGGDIDWDNEGMILAHQQVNYKKPIYLKDDISVLTWFEKSGTTSFELGYEIIRKEKDGSETICATGSSVQVCYNYKTQKPVPIPERWRQKMIG
jgi:acyl-CoA thioester hydrolase